jgi:hypothetical protein
MSKDDYLRYHFYLLFFDFIIQMTFGEVYKLWRSLRIFFHPPESASLFVSYVTRITLLSYTFHLLPFFPSLVCETKSPALATYHVKLRFV